MIVVFFEHSFKRKQVTTQKTVQDGGVANTEYMCSHIWKNIKIVLSLTEMASSSFTDAPNADSLDPENKSVTIVINDNGEINYDEKTLQSIIGKSNFQSIQVAVKNFQRFE